MCCWTMRYFCVAPSEVCQQGVGIAGRVCCLNSIVLRVVAGSRCVCFTQTTDFAVLLNISQLRLGFCVRVCLSGAVEWKQSCGFLPFAQAVMFAHHVFSRVQTTSCLLASTRILFIAHICFLIQVQPSSARNASFWCSMLKNDVVCFSMVMCTYQIVQGRRGGSKYVSYA